MDKKRPFIFSADVIRVIAILGVITVHTVNIIHARPDFLGGTTWWIANVLESLARISIPLFIMLSGYLILTKQETLVKALQRTQIRIILPLIVWTIFYLLWNAGNPSAIGLLTFFPRLFSGSVLHLYFLIIIAGLYIAAPFVRSYIAISSQKELQKVLVLFLSVGLLHTLAQYVLNYCYSTNMFTMWIPYLGYFFAGYVLGKDKPDKKITRLVVPVFIIGAVWTIVGNYVHLYNVREGLLGFHVDGCISPYFDHYISPNVMMMALSAFLFLFHFNYQSFVHEKVAKFVSSISQAALGIYLVHIFVIDVIERTLDLRIESFAINLLVYIVLKWIVVFFASYGITLLGLHIPHVRKIFGGK